MRFLERLRYTLRTNRSALDTAEIWNTYISLGRVETAFRNMKSHLGFRPVFHQCEARADAHLFISVVAYHLLQAIAHTLRQQGDTKSWWTIRNTLSTHQAYTLTYDELSDSQEWINHHVRATSLPDHDQKHIYTHPKMKPGPKTFQIAMVTYEEYAPVAI